MLLGNQADFDAIRARYQSLSYPTPEEASFNALRSNYEGLLTGSGYNTIMTPTTTAGDQVSFSVDPNTGQVTTNIPQYDMPTFENIYQGEEGLISEDAQQQPIMGQPLSAQRGGGENRPSPEQLARQKQRSALINEFKQNPYLEERLTPTITPNIFGLISGFLDDSYGKLADDILASTPFGVDTTYKGSSGIDRDPGDFGTPTSGPAATDTDLGKFGGSGYDAPSGNPFGGANVGSHKDGGKGGKHGPAGGQGGKNTGTARF
jgi:hypothetical protein